MVLQQLFQKVLKQHPILRAEKSNFLCKKIFHECLLFPCKPYYGFQTIQTLHNIARNIHLQFVGVAPIHQEFLQNKKLNLTMPGNFGQSYVKHFYTRYEYIGAKCQHNQSRIKPHCKCCQNVLLVLRVLNNIQNQIESTICCSFLGDQFLLDYVQKVGLENVAVILAV